MRLPGAGRDWVVELDMMLKGLLSAMMLCAVVGVVGCQSAPEETGEEWVPPVNEQAGERLAGEYQHWEISDYADPGKVSVVDGVISLPAGNDMTGITWRGPLLTDQYEISLDAMRVAGNDFFCGLTFPVGEDFCSFIVGGWGGTIVGISSVDYMDASENETSHSGFFENNQWYRVRVRVNGRHIQAWVDDKQYVDLNATGKRLDVRWEVEPSIPLGLATWRTGAAIKNFKQRALTVVELN